MTTKQLIKEYVDDHFKHFGFYPYDVEIDVKFILMVIIGQF